MRGLPLCWVAPLAKQSEETRALAKKKHKRCEAQIIGFPNSRKRVEITPRNHTQRELLKSITRNIITMAIGPAGTGKTYIAAMSALKYLTDEQVKKIVITRPVVTAGAERIGYLPGSLEEKMDPWLKPIFDVFEEYWSAKTIMDRIHDGTIEIVPLGFMRGRSFKDCFILADEIQNATLDQILMLLTRIDDGSKMVITGDPDQTDMKNLDVIHETARRLQNVKNIGIIEFDPSEVVRSDIVAAILEAW
ncbi:MAG: PhoH family protein [Gammaproteobacteria bacterium]|nr:MAG: PhoH family protein [Gammaproteobacteria bacterium]